MTVSYSIKEIREKIKGELMVVEKPNETINDILIDSRRLISSEGTLFFAIKTKRNDGHNFINELYNKGVRNFVIDDPTFETDGFNGANFILVNRSLIALQQLCSAHRRIFDLPVVGITGSNGKTIVKEWLFQLMSKTKKVIRSPKSYNSQIGVPLSVWQLRPEYDIAVFEAGISEPDEMEKLQSVIRPNIGIFTNLGEAHSENFIHIEQKAGEKLKLFTQVDELIYCRDHAEIQSAVIKSGLIKKIKTFTWSTKQEADLKISGISKIDQNKTRILAEFQNDKISIEIPFIDKASIENAIHCWCAMILLGFDQTDIKAGMARLQPIAMRLEMKEGINHCSIINDSYNSDINSITIALDFLNQQNQHDKKTVILSDVLQSGRNEEELYEEISGVINSKGISRIIGIGNAISRQADKFSIEKAFYTSTEEFMQKFSYSAFQNESILLKGARKFEFEQISKALQQKMHTTVLEINLDALVHNLNYFRSLLRPTTKIMAMVKAFSYGSGSFEIANLLQFHRIDYLAVAYADEGMELRKAGIVVPIMVMNPEEQSFDVMIKHNLEPEIYSFHTLTSLEEAIRKNILPSNKPVKVHLKIDTGMHRLGFTFDEIDEVIERVSKNRYIYLQSVFSHLAASEDPGNDDFTREQVARFEDMSSRITKTTGHKVNRHILNSAGISRFPEAQYEMVRLGIGLYGVSFSEYEQSKLRNVSSLKSSISQIKVVPKGDTVGYGRSWNAEAETRIAIIPVGYADGLDRKLSNGKGQIMVNGQKAPIIGDICMDMCMVDITGIRASEGDQVEIFGDARSPKKLASDLGTIPYEVFTNISRRVKRVYYHE